MTISRHIITVIIIVVAVKASVVMTLMLSL